MPIENKKDSSDSGPNRNSHLKLTKRGKTVVGLLIAAPILAGGTVAAEAALTTPEPVKTDLETISVYQGDTAWKIAEEINPKADPRDIINEIGKYNPDIESTGFNLAPGQQIKFPESDDTRNQG